MDLSSDIQSQSLVGNYVKALGYLGFEVSSLENWERFAEDVLGMQVRPVSASDVRFLKIDSRPWRFILTQGPADDIAFAGWEVADDATLDAYARHLADIGVATTWGDADDLALRSVDRLLRFTDPNGVIHEAFVDKLGSDGAFTPQRSKGGFITDPGGLGHIVFGTNDYPASVKFAHDVLGVGLTDTIEQSITDTLSIHVTFMHVNQRHHSIAFANRAGAKKLHHFMVEVERVEDVGYTRDRHLKSGLSVNQDIGQHPNDRVISYYGATPSGFMVEYGWGGVTVDVPTWTPNAYDRLSEWGHRPYAGGPSAPPKPAANEPPVSAPGRWNLVITTPMGEQKALLDLADDLSGQLNAMGEPVKIYDGAFAGGQLSFKADVTVPFPMTLGFSLALTGSSASGEVQAGPMGASPVKGERA